MPLKLQLSMWLEWLLINPQWTPGMLHNLMNKSSGLDMIFTNFPSQGKFQTFRHLKHFLYCQPSKHNIVIFYIGK